MEFVVQILTSRHGIVRCMTRGPLGRQPSHSWETHRLVRASSCQGRTAERERERERKKESLTLLYRLISYFGHAILRTIWKARNIISIEIPIISSSSSCRAASTDILDHLSPLLPIIHRLWQVFWVTSFVLT